MRHPLVQKIVDAYDGDGAAHDAADTRHAGGREETGGDARAGAAQTDGVETGGA